MNDSPSELKKNIHQLKKSRKFEAAINLCSQAIDTYSNDYEFYEARSEILKKSGNYSEAFLDLEKVIKLMPNEIAPIFRRGRWSLEIGHYDQTIQDMSLVLNSKNTYFKESAYYFRAQAFQYLEDYEKALSDCENIPNDFSLGPNQISKDELLKKITSSRKNSK